MGRIPNFYSLPTVRFLLFEAEAFPSDTDELAGFPRTFCFLVSFFGKARFSARPWVPLGHFVSLKILQLQVTETSCGSLRQKGSLFKGNEKA